MSSSINTGTHIKPPLIVLIIMNNLGSFYIKMLTYISNDNSYLEF